MEVQRRKPRNVVGADAVNCRSCLHANLKRCREMARLGFCTCNVGVVWKYLPGHYSCSKWAEK